MKKLSIYIGALGFLLSLLKVCELIDLHWNWMFWIFYTSTSLNLIDWGNNYTILIGIEKNKTK